MAGLRTIGKSVGRLGRLDIHFYVARPFLETCCALPNRFCDAEPRLKWGKTRLGGEAGGV